MVPGEAASLLAERTEGGTGTGAGPGLVGVEGAAVGIGSGPGALVVAGAAKVVAAADVEGVAGQAAAEKELQ